MFLFAGLAASAPGSDRRPERVVVVDDKTYPPFAFLSADGVARGITVDIWNLWSRKTGIAVEFRLMEWSEALRAVRAGEADVVASFFRTPDRERDFDFTSPFHLVETAIFFHGEIGGIKGIPDLAGFAVGCVAEDSAEELLRASGGGIRVITYPDYESMVRDAAEGRLKVFLTDVPVAHFFLSQHAGGGVFRHSPPVARNGQHAGVRKGNRELLGIVQEGFDRISEDELDRIHAAWVGSTFSPLVWPVLAWGLPTALLLLAAAYAWNVSLRRRVRAAVRELEATNRDLLGQQAALRESERRFRELIDLAVDGILGGSPEGVVTLANSNMGRIMGMPSEAMVGRHIREFFPPRVLAEKPLRFDLLERGERVVSERELLRPDGTVVLIEMHSKKMPDGGYQSFVRDISERKREQESLLRTQFAMDHARDGIIWVDGDGRLVYVNNSSCTSLGYGREELLQMDIFGFDPDFPRDQWEQHKETMRRLGSMSFETRHQAKDGRTFPVEVNTNFFEFDGEWTACAFVRDISERKQREEELAQSRRMLREVLDTIPARVFWKDREGRYLGCNRQFAQDAGMTDPKDVVGKDDFAMGWSKRAELYRADDRQVIESGEPKLNFEEPQATPAGRDVWLRTSKIPLRDEQGNVYGVLGAYEDITERHLAEAELRESHERLLTVMNRIEAVIYIADMATYEILFVNEYGRRKWGRVLVGRTCWQVWQNQPGPCPFCTNDRLVDAAGKPGEVVHWERQNPIDGRWYELRDCAIHWTDGRLVRMQVATDISDRKQAEQLLGAKNKELEQIIYVASHDLRSPLVNVDGYSRELEFSVEELHSALAHGGAEVDLVGGLRATLPEMVAALRHIRNSTRQMDTLLKGLLKLSRSGRASLTIGPVDMNALLAQVVAGLEFQTRESGAAVHLGALPPCLGDAVQLGQVFQNLIGNALKFLDPARPGVVQVSGTAEPDCSVYCVEDNGIGIAPEHQNNILELFHRLDPAATEGEGLGLTIVQQTLGRLNGRLWLESVPGTGSRFYVSLPSVPQQERSEQA